MSRSALRALLAFSLAALIAVGAVGLISKQAVEAERARAAAGAAALLEENVRLALWRMDSEVAALIATENSRPYFAYRAYYAPSRAYQDMMASGSGDAAVTASPLLAQTPQYVRLHFQLEPDGEVTSPQVPSAALAARAAGAVDPARLELSRARLDALTARLDRPVVEAAVGSQRRLQEMAEQVAVPPPPQLPSTLFGSGGSGARGTVEWRARSRNVRQANQYNPVSSSGRADLRNPAGVPRAEVVEAVMAPVWMKDDLLLVRRLEVGRKVYLQGAWLDWEHMQRDLLTTVTDLLPEARLEPLRPGTQAPRMRLLASLPVRLEPGPLPAAALPAPDRALSYGLAAAWAGVLVALIAFGALMVGAVSLSERRATFVSAVTHELRTPLTTFQMYTEMLSEGMVAEDKRDRYLQTLRREAVRLGHLVENVLAYARVERGRAQGRPEQITVAELTERLSPRLSERAAQADMTLRVQLAESAEAVELLLDTTAVDQILFNLVDNACKYACDASDRRIDLRVEAVGRKVSFTVADHGPGVPAPERRRLFAPFSKSAQRAALSAPGVGLGLALGRRLARALGGDLRLQRSAGPGACFVLWLPAR